MTWFCNLFRRLLLRKNKGEEEDEEGSVYKESSQQGESIAVGDGPVLLREPK